MIYKCSNFPIGTLCKYQHQGLIQILQVNGSESAIDCRRITSTVVCSRLRELASHFETLIHNCLYLDPGLFQLSSRLQKYSMSKSIRPCLMAAMLVVIGSSTALSTLGVVQHHAKDRSLLALIVAGYLVALACAVSMLMVKLAKSHRWVNWAVTAMPMAFQLVSGMVWVIQKTSLVNTRDSYETRAAVGLFIINEVCASMALTMAVVFSSPEVPPPDQESALNASHTITWPNSAHAVANLHTDKHTIESHDTAVSKKVSEQTLVDHSSKQHLHTNSSDSRFADTVKFKRISEHSAEFASHSDIIRACTNAQKRETYSDSNWMGSGTNILCTPPPSASSQCQSTMVIAGLLLLLLLLPQNILRSYSHNLRNSASVPTFFKLMRKPDTARSKLLVKTSFVEVESKFNVPTPPLQDEEKRAIVSDTPVRRVSLIKAPSEQTLAEMAGNCSQTKRKCNPVELDDPQVKRSKSASHVGDSRARRREERWRSIVDEREFLLQVNESLLPSVLKSGESPIMRIKRQQLTSFDRNSPTSLLQPQVDVVPAELADVSDDEVNLPQIGEFGEHQEEHDFENFTQDTIVLPRLNDNCDEELHGLEQIPKSTSFQQPPWNQTPPAKTLISPLDWEINSSAWQEHRQRVGSGPNPVGVQITVSTADKSTSKTRPSFALLNRSFSAPSLHTFRNASVGSSSSDHAALRQQTGTISTDLTLLSNNQLQHCKTPTVVTTPTASSSPVRKFLHGSPKRIRSVFRKLSFSTSRKSLDVDFPNISHKHNSSVISNAFSLSSSKSGSPKKSIKAFLLRTPTHHAKNVSEPSFDFHRETEPLQLQASHWHTTPKLYSYKIEALRPQEPAGLDFSDRWNFDLETTPGSDQSRVSSVPSAVIGEYDREKWRTLKVLEKRDKLTLS